MSHKPLQIPSGQLIFRDITYKGFWLHRWANEHSLADRQVCVATGLVTRMHVHMLVSNMLMEECDRVHALHSLIHQHPLPSHTHTHCIL